MKRQATRFLSIGIGLVAAAAAVQAQDKAMSDNASFKLYGVVRDAADLHPFTNVASIPAGADLSSIRFAGVKTVNVATKRVSNGRYCEDSQEPGGSMYCPSAKDLSPMPAYRITYSYDGPAMPSDEYGSTHFAFSVYLHPDQLDPAIREAISARRLNPADAAAHFKLTTYREPVTRVVIDKQNSTFCDGAYMDGSWSHADSKCEDKIAYKTVAEASTYVSVKIDPVAFVSSR
jgi:hypothetical protein